MTCECGQQFELHEGDDQSLYEERLAGHILTHRRWNEAMDAVPVNDDPR
jgi:hypothetical protein